MAGKTTDIRGSRTDSIKIEGEPVKVFVGGGNPKAFFVHPSLLVKHSAFFAAALKKDWQEGQDRAVKLPEAEPEVFSNYVQWLYSGAVPCKDATNSGEADLIKLWILADLLMAPKLQDLIATTIITARRTEKCTLAWEVVNETYSKTAEGSPLRRLVIDLYVKAGTADWLSKDTRTVPQEFMTDLTKALLSQRMVKETAKTEELKGLYAGVPCGYHVHDKDKPCDGDSTGSPALNKPSSSAFKRQRT
ncbi:hypothetical protein LTS10_011848 [Elasticomyces elasticus]|nr:hypothetical protein LTS10_011848 [Elasticomyces elasticus]